MLTKVSALLDNYSDGGRSAGEITETANALQETLRNIQPLLLQLNQKPNRLIFSDDNDNDMQPKAARKGIFDEN